MADAASDKAENPSADVVECYGTAPLRGEEVALHCALYLPETERPPLVVWFHDGAFVTGDYQHRRSRILGRNLRASGFAMASVSYRLKSSAADLSEDLRERFKDIQSHKRKFLKPFLSRYRALAAMEDGFRFLDWAQKNAGRFGWSERLVLAGSSAGGITAFNMAFTAKVAGFEPPKPDGILSVSGGHAYPGLVSGDLVGKVLALHNPLDDRVPVRSVRKMQRTLGPQMELIEDRGMTHANPQMNAEETRAQSYGRIVDFVADVTA